MFSFVFDYNRPFRFASATKRRGSVWIHSLKELDVDHEDVKRRGLPDIINFDGLKWIRNIQQQVTSDIIASFRHKDLTLIILND